MHKRRWLLLFAIVFCLVGAWQVRTAAATAVYYVAVDGKDDTGDGSAGYPWATITHALTQVPDGATILVGPGTYYGQVSLKGSFTRGVTIRAAEPYQTRLRHSGTVITCFEAQGITLEGFDVAHSGPEASPYVVQIQDLLGDVSGGDNAVSRIVFRNNILHDSYNDDIVKVNNGAREVLFEGNIFYNQGGPGLDSHIDVNSVRDIVIQDNIFFNDFAGSGRQNDNETGSFIVIKDSNARNDTNLGSENIIVRRNVLLNWEGAESNSFFAVGEDSVPYFQAMGVLIENNLIIGNSANPLRATLVVRGSRDVTFRHNTVVGDLPSRAFAIRLDSQDRNPPNQNIALYNNVWSDPTGTMGARDREDENDFSDAPPLRTNSFVLLNNLYWNGGRQLPFDRGELVNYWDDPFRLVSDPLLPAPDTAVVPRWVPQTGRFADGSSTIRLAFIRLVLAFGVPDSCSPLIDTADPSRAASEDIWGNSRLVQKWPDIGAYETALPAINCAMRPR